MADTKNKRTSVVLTPPIRQDIERISSLSGKTQSHIIMASLKLGLSDLRDLMPSLLGIEQPEMEM